jgi:hypothetical protein
MLPTESAATRVRELLMADLRPFLTMGFGYRGQDSYWLGGAGIRQVPDMKKFGKVCGYKIDTVAWSYAGNIPTVTLNGMAGKTLSLVEHRKPTDWSGKNLVEITQGIADEHGVEFRITGQVPAHQRLAHAMQFSGESRADALGRLLSVYGATMDVTTEPAYETPGASRAYQFEIKGKSGNPTYNDAGTVRTIFTIRAISEQFIDLGGLEASREIVIGYMPSLSPAKFGSGASRLGPGEQASGVRAVRGSFASPPDYLASKVEITEEGFARGAAATAGVNLAGKTQKGAVADKASKAQVETSAGVFTGQQQANFNVKANYLIAPDDSTSKAAPGDVGTTPNVMSALPEDLGGMVTTKARAEGSAAAFAVKTKIELDICPGAPELVNPGLVFRLVGTHTHDGLCGIEEARITLDRDNGLQTSIVARPYVEARTGNGDAATAAGSAGAAKANGTKPLGARVETSAGVFTGQQQANFSVKANYLIYEDQTPKPESAEVTGAEVPAAPPGGDAALEAEIRSAETPGVSP